MNSHNLIRDAVRQVRGMIGAAALKAAEKGELPDVRLPEFTVEIPADTTHGDFAANIAMVSARALHMPPRKIAEIIAEGLDFTGSYFRSAQVAGPGFLNFFAEERWFSDVLSCISQRGRGYGRTHHGESKKVMVEFVSANPTGPMHMGNARGGAIGDVLAAALFASGHDVSREFYVNDAGNQIDKFAMSLEARYLQHYKGEETVAFPEDGYQGEDITDRAREFSEQNGDMLLDATQEERREALVRYALPHNIEAMKSDLRKYRIEYDRWFHESELYESGLVERVVELLTEKGLTFQKDGAVWYKATEFGGEKDEVLIRQNGNATYFAADIAYHYDKFVLRRFDTVVDVWGADHHGHVARLKGAMDALGIGGDRLVVVLMQLVNLLKDGEPYRMSKRSGRTVTLSDLLELVPVDAARFFFNMQQPGSAMDFDLDLAVEQSSQNPVFYVQYAHARICSILKKLDEQGIAPRDCDYPELALLTAPEERELIRKLSQLPREIIAASSRYDPTGLTHYAIEVATLFHKFYAACRVQVDTEPLMQARLCLCLCTRTTIANTLELLGVVAPDSM